MTTTAVNASTIPPDAHRSYAIRAENYDPLFLDSSITAFLAKAHITPQADPFEILFGFSSRQPPHAHFRPPPNIENYTNRFFGSSLSPHLTPAVIERAEQKLEDISPLTPFLEMLLHLGLLQEEVFARRFACMRE